MTFFNPDYSASRRNRLATHQSVLQRLLQRRQTAANSYTQGANKIELDRPGVFRNILNNAAGRGMAYSSGYGEQVSQANTGFANALANLASQRDAELSSTDLDQSEEDSAFNYDLQDLNNQQALYDAQNNQNLVAALAAQKAQSAQTALTQAKTAQAQAAAKKPKPLFGGLRRRL